MWQRFRTACDTFFDRYKRRDQIELEVRQADREALVTELESLLPADRVPADRIPADPMPAEGIPADPMPADRMSAGEMPADPMSAGEMPADVMPAGEMPAEGSDAGLPASEIVGAIPSPPPAPVENAALLEQVRSLRSRWNQSSPAVRHGADPLSGRFMSALERLLTGYPEAFRGSELDVEANRLKMEKLCERVEGFLSSAGPAPASSGKALAEMLREALASNTIGGRAGEEAKWRAMGEEVRNAQASWSRLGPVPGDVGRQLGDRFHRACSRFFDQLRRHVPQQEPAPRRGKPVGAR
jgi:hypothetical protein